MSDTTTTFFERCKSSFQGLPRLVWILGAVVLMNSSGRMVSTFLAVYLLTVLDLSSQWIGLIIASHGCGAVCGALAGGWISSRLAAVPVMAGSLVFTGIGYVSLLAVDGPGTFLAVAFACAFFEGLFRPPLMLILMEATGPVDRPRSYSVYYTALCFGYAMGAVIGGQLSKIDFSLIFWVDGATCLLATAVLLAYLPLNAGSASGERNEAGKSPKESDALQGRTLAFVVVCVVALLNYSVAHQRRSTYPLYLTTHYDLDPAQLGVVLMTNGLLVALTGILVTEWVKHLDLRLIASIGSVLLCGSFAALPIGDLMWFALVIAAVMSVGEVLFVPAIVSLAYAHAGRRDAGTLLGIFYAINCVCRALGPALGVWAFGFAGAAVTWLACGVAGLASAALLLGLLKSASPRS